MTPKFNPPPGWPPPPAEWVPPEGWQPDPSWPVPPAGWPLWIDDSTHHQDQQPEVHGAGPEAYPPGGVQAPGVGLTALGGPSWQAGAGPTAPPLPPATGRPRRRRLAPWLIAGAALALVSLAVVVAVVVVNRAPSAPTGLAAAAVDGSSVTISWTPPADGPAIDRYVIARDGAEIGSVPGSASTYVDGGLSPAKTYTYSVVAVSESRRSTPTPELSVTPMAPSPSALTAVEHTTTSIALAWEAPVSSPTPDQYVIFRDGDQIATVAGSDPTFADRKLTPATTYKYTIAAAWASRTSEPSVVLSLKTNTPTLSAARLAGYWPIRLKMTQSGGSWPKVGKKWDVGWEFKPKCDSGPCTVTAYAQIYDYNDLFKLVLTRQGAGYSGTIKMRYSHCRSKTIKDTITIRVQVSKAGLVEGEWVATDIKGTLKVRSPYTRVGNWYCPAQTHAMSVTGTVG